MSFTSSFPTNLPKLSVPGVKVPRYTYVCNILLKYVELGDIIDPENHRNAFTALKCVVSEVAAWSTIVEGLTG